MTDKLSEKFEGGEHEFHLGDIISVYHGVMVSPSGMDGIHDTLNFLTGKSLTTDLLPAAADFCRPFIEKQFPEITQINGKSVTAHAKKAAEGGKREEAVKTWLNNQVQAYGETVSLHPLSTDEMKGFGEYMVKNSLLLKREDSDSKKMQAIEHKPTNL